MVVTSIFDMSMPETNTTTNKQGKEKAGNTKKGNGQKCGKTVLTSHSNFSDLKLSANVKPALRYNILTRLSF